MLLGWLVGWRKTKLEQVYCVELPFSHSGINLFDSKAILKTSFCYSSTSSASPKRTCGDLVEKTLIQDNQRRWTGESSWWPVTA